MFRSDCNLVCFLPKMRECKGFSATGSITRSYVWFICRKKCCKGFKFVLGQCIPEGRGNIWMYINCLLFYPRFFHHRSGPLLFLGSRVWHSRSSSCRLWCVHRRPLWAAVYRPFWSGGVHLLPRLPLRPRAPQKPADALLFGWVLHSLFFKALYVCKHPLIFCIF